MKTYSYSKGDSIMHCMEHPEEKAVIQCECSRWLCEACSSIMKEWNMCSACVINTPKKIKITRDPKNTIRIDFSWPDALAQRKQLCTHMVVHDFDDSPPKLNAQVIKKTKKREKPVKSVMRKENKCFKEWYQDKEKYVFGKAKIQNTLLAFVLRMLLYIVFGLWFVFKEVSSGIGYTLKRLLKGNKIGSMGYYRASPMIFSFYRFICICSILLAIGLFFLLKQEMTIGHVIIFCCLVGSFPISLFGVVDILFQLRKKNSRFRLFLEFSFYYLLFIYICNRIKSAVENPDIVLYFQLVIVYIGPIIAVVTEIRMWKARKHYYSRRKKYSPYY